MKAVAAAAGGAIGVARPDAWYVCLPRAKQELTTGYRLLEQGYEAHVPQPARCVRHAQGWQLCRSPLFTRYAFILPSSASQYFRQVRKARGISTFGRLGTQVAWLPSARTQPLREPIIQAETASSEHLLTAGIPVVHANAPLDGVAAIVSGAAETCQFARLTILAKFQQLTARDDHLARV